MHKITVLVSGGRPCYALVDRVQKLIRKDQGTGGLAIFETREAARAMRKRVPGTKVVPIILGRQVK